MSVSRWRKRAAVAFLVASALASISLQAWGFRTATDDPDFAGSIAVVTPSPPLAFEISTEAPAPLRQIDVERAAREAADTWLAPPCARPAISFNGSTLVEAAPGDGRNTIHWVLDWSAIEQPADAAAATDVQYAQTSSGDWFISEADIYLNASLEWQASNGQPDEAEDAPKDLQAVLTHELGHALGLLHPCEITATASAPKCTKQHVGAAMHPTYSPAQRALSADDIAGVCFLYPAVPCSEAGCPVGEGCTPAGCVALCGDATCDANEVCVRQQCLPSDACQLTACLDELCKSDSDCAFREFCSSGRCVRGAIPFADPCTKSVDCFDGACFEGACAASCAADVDCPRNAECDRAAGVCRDSLQPFGERCNSATECRSDKCLVEGNTPAVCTRACGEGLPECPLDWSCATADGERVCAPAHLSIQGGGGCNLVAASHDAHLQRALAITFLAALAAVITRSRRRYRLAPPQERQ